MFDKEIEAIAKCTELIKDLEGDAKMRVVKYLIERFGIGANQLQYAFEPTSNNISKQNFILETQQTTQFIDVEDEEYPTLKQLLIKNYPKNETEWILCYAFFASNFGEDTFKKEDILEKYKENNRSSASNRANLSNNLNACIKKDWIKDVNKDEFILKIDGLSYVKEVLKGNSLSKEVKRTKRNNSNENQ
jgi:hypothetical protein